MRTVLCLLVLCLSTPSPAQHEFTKWFFGVGAGLDFMTTPPSVISNTVLSTNEGCASASDGAGNLLFLTDGLTIWNKQQQVMVNGAGLLGNKSSVQAALIAKQPGNASIYYVFTLDDLGGADGLRYSLVDMSLAAGLGAVTVKNATISTPCTEQLSATRHCNGTDIWIVTHDFNTNNFKSFLLSSAGLNLTPVISAVGNIPTLLGQGTIKLSPSGKKLGCTYFSTSNSGEVTVFDFDQSTGIVSNSLSLVSNAGMHYGCEFSGDGTKFYTANSNNPNIYQWDLCAGTNTQILASKTTVGTSTNAIGQLQLAPDGKIYIVDIGKNTLSFINAPNQAGTACNFVPQALSIAPGIVSLGLPTFIGGVGKTPPASTYTINPLISCGTASFTGPSVNAPSCGASGFQVTGIKWDFGQPQTGALNTSTLNNPVHDFGGPGTYKIKMVMDYTCGADTFYKDIVISLPSMTVSSSGIGCSSPGTATLAITGSPGPFSYTWLPSGQTTQTATVNMGTQVIQVHDSNGNCTYTVATVFQPSVPLTGTVNPVNSCYDVQTGSASISLSAGSGGTGNYSYSWSNGQTTPIVTGLSAGIYTVTVTEGSCSVTHTFQIKAPYINVAVYPSTTKSCVGYTYTLSANAIGGNGAFTYTWTNGQSTASFVTTPTVSGIMIYQVNAIDQNGCIKVAAAQVIVDPSPEVAVKNSTTCPKQNVTLQASGASSYTWLPGGGTGTSLAVSPLTTQVYTVTGSFTTGCTSAATATVSVLNCSSINENSEATSVLKLYPNPAFDELFVETEAEAEIMIFDIAGREMIREKLRPGINTVDVTALKSGVYFLNVPGKKQYPAYKVVKLD